MRSDNEGGEKNSIWRIKTAQPNNMKLTITYQPSPSPGRPKYVISLRSSQFQLE